MDRVRFGAFEVDPHARELRKCGVRIRLENQPFEVLLALLERPGEIITRSDLQQKLWPEGTFVDFDRSLTKAVNKLCAALMDPAACPRYVETSARRGYRFIAAVEPVGVAQEGTAGSPSAKAETARYSARRPWFAAAGVAGLLLAFAVLASLDLPLTRRSTRPAVPHIDSLAVLPFTNLTGDPDQERFADGVTDQLISNLSRIGALTVVSRASCIRYKGGNRSVPEIARELRVDGIVEGAVHGTARNLRVNVRLMHGPEDRQVWAATFEEDASAGPELERRITLALAHQISARITADDRSRLMRRGPRNPAAYDAYLQGRQRWNQRADNAISEAETYFRQALTEDPGFSLAWSGLADCYTIGWFSANRDFHFAEECARKAVQLEPDLAEGHASLAMALMCLYRYPEAETELQRGIALAPNYVPARQFYTIWLLTMGRLKEALAESDRALHLDPFSLPVNNMRAFVLTEMRQYDRALEQARVTALLEPQASSPYEVVARIYWLRGQATEALLTERKMAALASRADWDAAALEATARFRLKGHKAACGSIAASKAAMYPKLPFGVFRIPYAFGHVQDGEQVLNWLDRLLADGGYEVPLGLATAPEYDFLRHDSRFRALLQRLGIPESPQS